MLCGSSTDHAAGLPPKIILICSFAFSMSKFHLYLELHFPYIYSALSVLSLRYRLLSKDGRPLAASTEWLMGIFDLFTSEVTPWNT